MNQIEESLFEVNDPLLSSKFDPLFSLVDQMPLNIQKEVYREVTLNDKPLFFIFSFG